MPSPALPRIGRHHRVMLALLGLVMLAACKDENRYVAPPPAKVTVAAPVQRNVTRYLVIPGNATPVNSVNLVARVPGYLQQITYQDGQVVQRGANLFLIEQDQYQAALAEAQASLAAAQARLVQAEAEFTRQSTLGRQDFAAQSAVDQARAKRDEAKANVDQAQASLRNAQINLGYTQVTAPFDGVVSARVVSVGQLVGQGSPTTLSTIVQLNPIWVTFTISEQDMLRIRRGMEQAHRTLADIGVIEVDAALQIESGFPHRGRLDYISPTVDQATGTLGLRAVFENPTSALLPGNYVRIRLPVERIQNALLVPVTAIGADQGGRYVLVVNANNVVEQRRIRVGQQEEDQMQVVEDGLSAQDRVVVDGLLRAIPGQRVEPELRQPAPATAAAAPAAPATARPAR